MLWLSTVSNFLGIVIHISVPLFFYMWVLVKYLKSAVITSWHRRVWKQLWPVLLAVLAYACTLPIDNKNLNKIIIIKPYIIASSPWEEAAEVPWNKTKGTSPNITEGEEYEFRVIAVNKGGSGELSEPSKYLLPSPDSVSTWVMLAI